MNNSNPLPDVVYAFGFSNWKQQLLVQFLPEQKILPVKYLDHVPNGATLLVWGHRKQNKYFIHPNRSISIVSVEDGFLRSVGLGAHYQIRPLSWIIDHRGIYFDPTSPSDLEHLLLNYEFSPEELTRAKIIRERIIEFGLTKYNVGQTNFTGFNRLQINVDQPIILVPGQVESDASLNYGASLIRKNIDLLQTVRTANPDAYIIYKPHPDVVAGLRRKGHGENHAGLYCNQIITDISIHTLLKSIDEVHLMTSLTGFEALLREKKVVCYGQPFYAGWGLTIDMLSNSRRNRRLTLDELVATTLLIYPLYLSMRNSCLIDAEKAIDELLTYKSHSSFQPWTTQFVGLIHKFLKSFMP